MSEEKVLTNEIAEQFLADNGSVDLSEFTEIEDVAAESLSKYQGEPLYLNGLTELSDAAAESLSKYQGPPYSSQHLYLNGLTVLSDAAAESLSKFRGTRLESLHLEGLLEALLNGRTELSDAAAESLSKLKETLDVGRREGLLEGLTQLSDAAILCCIANQEYDLPNVTDITPKQIRLLGNGFNTEGLTLGITKITKEQALAFSEFWWMELYLLEVTELDDETAEILADVKADLSIAGVSALSPRAARAIASRWRDRGDPFSSEDTADFTIEHWKQMYYGAKQGLEIFKEVLKWPSDYDESYWGPNE